MLLLYLLLLCFWGWKLQQYHYHIINLHWCVLAVISVSLFDAIMRFGQFLYDNANGESNFELIFFQVIV